MSECASCRHFIDYREETPEPDECNGYCGELVDRLGLREALRVNPYGGRWVHHTETCERWEGGTPVWVRYPAPPKEIA